MTSRISRLPSFPSPLSPLSSSKPYKLRFSISTCRVTRIFFNEFKHRRSHRSISILIRRVYNGATSKENREIVSGLATRHDFLSFFFYHDRSKGCRDLQTRLHWERGGKKFIFFGLEIENSELESFPFLFFSLFLLSMLFIVNQTCQVVVISQNYLRSEDVIYMKM